MGRMWQWLKDEHHRGTLTLFATVVAGAIGGLWTFYTYKHPAAPAPSPKPVESTIVQTPKLRIYGLDEDGIGKTENRRP